MVYTHNCTWYDGVGRFGARAAVTVSQPLLLLLLCEDAKDRDGYLHSLDYRCEDGLDLEYRCARTT